MTAVHCPPTTEHCKLSTDPDDPGFVSQKNLNMGSGSGAGRVRFVHACDLCTPGPARAETGGRDAGPNSAVSGSVS